MVFGGVGHLVFSGGLGVDLGFIDGELHVGVCVILGEDLLEIRDGLAHIAVAVAGGVDDRSGLVGGYDRLGLDSCLVSGAVGEYYLDLLLSLDAPVRLIYKSRLDAANVDDICYKLDRLAVVAGAAGAVDALGRGGGGVLHGDADDYPAVAFC